MNKSKCSKCGGTGWIADTTTLGKLSGKPIPTLKRPCECNADYGDNAHEHYQPITPDMYDFPMSNSFRGFSFEYCGVPDPGYIPPEKPPEPVVTEVIHRHSDMGKKEFNELRQLRFKVDYLEKLLRSHEVQLKQRQGKRQDYY
jgi:hypothetical protein